MRVCVLMPWGRVGSNLMMSYLRSILKGQYANEPFNAIKDKDGQVKWLKDFYLNDEEGSDRCAKLSVRSMDKIKRIEIFLNNRNVRVIRMFRKNHLKTVISQIRAEQYAEFTKAQTGKAKWAVRLNDEPLPPTDIDISLLSKRIKIIENDQNELRAMKLDHHVDVIYEDIVVDMNSVFRSVAEFLGKEHNSDFKPPFRKATPNNLAEAILNFDDVKSWVKSNGYSVSEMEN